jgi:hypothetical protein
MEKLKLYGIIIGICAMLAGLLGWYGSIGMTTTWGTGVLLIWPILSETGATGITMLLMALLLTVAGVLYLLSMFKPDIEMIEKIKKPLALVGIIASLGINMMFIILWDLPIFGAGGGGYIGLGVGFFLGIAALVFIILLKFVDSE